MDIPLDEVIYVEAISSGSTGVAVDADSTPTFAVYEESTDTDIGVGGNMAKRTSLTGNYRASFTASAANGFELGKWYSVIGSATIGGIACKGVLKSFRIVAAENTAGYRTVDAAKWNNLATVALPLAPTTAGRTLDVSAGGEAGIDWANVGGQSTSVNLSATTTNLVNTVTTYTGNTPQTGDVYALANGVAGFVAIKADTAATLIDTNELQTDWVNGGRLDLILDAILVDTAEIGAAGAGLTALASAANLATLTTYVDTEVAAIKAKTDNLPTDPADASDIASSFSTVNSTLSTIAGYIDTEVAAIKAKTDQITFTNTNKVDASLQAVGDVVDAVATKLAAIILRMTMANVEAHASGDALNVSSLYGAIQMAQEWSSSGVTITIRKTDGTSLGTKTATTAASGDVITGLT